MRIAVNIKHYRKQAGLTQEELAERLDVARSTITQWETGWSSPRMGMVQKLAEVFGITPVFLRISCPEASHGVLIPDTSRHAMLMRKAPSRRRGPWQVGSSPSYEASSGASARSGSPLSSEMISSSLRRIAWVM